MCIRDSCKIAYPLIALCTAVLIAWIWGKKNAVNAITNGGTLDDRFSKVWFNTVKFVCPIFLMIVVLSGFGIIKMCIRDSENIDHGLRHFAGINGCGRDAVDDDRVIFAAVDHGVRGDGIVRRRRRRHRCV